MKVEKIKNAPAKVNLTLDITGIDERGYHTLNSFMQTVSLCDIIKIEYQPNTPFSLFLKTLPEMAAGCDERENLCYKTAERFCSEFGISEGRIEITLQKNIPIKAGLGGGSSDAAAVISLLAEIFSVTDEKWLISLASKIGSDVPFFLKGGLSLISGAGEIITPKEGKISGFFLLVKPQKGLTAREVYQKYDELSLEKTDFSSLFEKSGYSIEYINNSLEKPAFLLCGECEEIRDRLLLLGAKKALLSGSGTTVFGYFESEEKAIEAEKSFKNYYTAVCHPIYN